MTIAIKPLCCASVLILAVSCGSQESTSGVPAQVELTTTVEAPSGVPSFTAQGLAERIQVGVPRSQD